MLESDAWVNVMTFFLVLDSVCALKATDARAAERHEPLYVILLSELCVLVKGQGAPALRFVRCEFIQKLPEEKHLQKIVFPNQKLDGSSNGSQKICFSK